MGQTLTVAAPFSSARSVVFVLDLSGSMDDAAGDGRTRLEAAQAALADVLARAPDGWVTGVCVDDVWGRV